MKDSSTFEFSIGAFRTTVTFSEDFPSIPDDPVLVVQDEHTAVLFPYPETQRVIIPSGEEGKNWHSIEKILGRALARGLERRSLFVGIGGGVVCDVTAFAASLYMRGARLHLVPTTLLAMVDASFGGKTAINFQGWKNMVGTFYPAEQIWIHPKVLKTLPERELRSGMAEVIKSAMLMDAELFQLLEGIAEQGGSLKNLSLGTYETLIRRSLLVKAFYVTKDLREQELRAHLNLGHTFGHGLESATHFQRYTHGEAVAWGLYRAMDAGLSLRVTEPAYGKRVQALLTKFGYAERVSGVRTEEILNAMQQDKKKRGTLRFLLQRTLGDTVLTTLDPDLVKQVIERGLEP
ncbi:MAG: 3-dehydroquinate synthase [Spirochaetes bacterium]|nr:3-dehydroquinate synthase [Spirochaetota bacterium]